MEVFVLSINKQFIPLNRFAIKETAIGINYLLMREILCIGTKFVSE